MPEPHDVENTVISGAPRHRARAALIMVHGRGATAESILSLADHLGRSDIAYLAPQATGNSWYPYSFLAPTERNEPFLSSALSVLGGLVDRLGSQGFPPERIGLLGFSQGACLSTEFIARNARRYGAVIGLSGALIGPPGTPRSHAGSLAGTPVFLGCSDIDPHIPLEHVEETAEVLAGLGASVDKRIYPGFGHSVNEDEIEAARALVAALVTPA
jgi:predicted esterase